MLYFQFPIKFPSRTSLYLLCLCSWTLVCLCGTGEMDDFAIRPHLKKPPKPFLPGWTILVSPWMNGCLRCISITFQEMISVRCLGGVDELFSTVWRLKEWLALVPPFLPVLLSVYLSVFVLSSETFYQPILLYYSVQRSSLRPPPRPGHISPFYDLTSDPPLMHSLHSRRSFFALRCHG